MITKEYSNGEITILWKPEKCIHSGICVKTLPNVYHPKEKPWIQPNNASSQELIDQVAKCPSGALSIKKSESMVRIEREEQGNKGRFAISKLLDQITNHRMNGQSCLHTAQWDLVI